jgi:hypothetical protein
MGGTRCRSRSGTVVRETLVHRLASRSDAVREWRLRGESAGWSWLLVVHHFEKLQVIHRLKVREPRAHAAYASLILKQVQRSRRVTRLSLPTHKEKSIDAQGRGLVELELLQNRQRLLPGRFFVYEEPSQQQNQNKT